MATTVLDILLSVDYTDTVDGRQDGSFKPEPYRKCVTVAGTGYLSKRVVVGTSKETVTLPDITTPGYVLIISLEPDEGNFVSHGQDGDSPHGELKPGEFSIFRAARSGFVLSMKANTASVPVLVVVIPD